MLATIVQANFVTLVGLIFTVFFISSNPLFQKKQNYLFLLAIICNIFLLVVTSLDFVFSRSGADVYMLRRITSFLNFGLGPIIPLLLWWIFSEKKLKSIAFIPLLFNLFVSFISMSHKIVFFISNANTYGRGPFFFLSVLTSIFYLMMMIRQPVKRMYSKHAERIFLMFVIVFMVVSVGAEVILGCQFINYNTSGISLILYYLLLTLQANIVDPLTGAYNRFLYEHETQKIQSKSSCIVTMLDINNFKQINDQFGHSNGDQCLTHFATTLMANVPSSKVYRIGGDEFVIISKKCTLDFVQQKMKEIRTTLNEVELDFAYGSCAYEPSLNITEVLETADQLMYIDKKNAKKLVYSGNHSLQKKKDLSQ